MISLVRVDNRLIHGQVIETWLPHLKVKRVVVADDEAAQSPLIRAAMGLAVHPNVEVQVLPMGQVDFGGLSKDEVRTLLLLRDVGGVLQARGRGLLAGHVNVGNVHFAKGRVQITPSVFLSQDELNQLKMLAEAGVEVEARAVPSDRPVGVSEMESRFGKGAG